MSTVDIGIAGPSFCVEPQLRAGECYEYTSGKLSVACDGLQAFLVKHVVSEPGDCSIGDYVHVQTQSQHAYCLSFINDDRWEPIDPDVDYFASRNQSDPKLARGEYFLGTPTFDYASFKRFMSSGEEDVHVIVTTDSGAPWKDCFTWESGAEVSFVGPKTQPVVRTEGFGRLLIAFHVDC